MPRDSNGNYSLPPSYLAVTGQDITVTQHNPPFEDVAAALTGSLPRSGIAPMLANLPMGGFKVTGMANGIAPTDGATVGQIANITPIGAVSDYALKTLPTGWLWCDGSVLLSTTAYSALRNALIADGFLFGQDGSGNPKLPDARGRSSAGRDDMGGTAAGRLGNTAGFNANASVLGATGGSEGIALSIAQMPAHNHGGATTVAGAHNHFYFTTSFGTGSGLKSDSGVGVTYPQDVTSIDGNHVHTIPSQGSGAAHSNVQPTIIFNKIIRAL